MRTTMTGNEACAYGAKLARAEVVAAYPITPQTSIVEKIAHFVSNGEMKSQFIKVESEHSAMAASIAASNTGARAFTATSSHGLALMHELLMWASGARLPIVMGAVNRAMGPPWSVWADHQDTMAERDTGWMQFYCESNQEVLDTILMSYKTVENHDVLIPAMIIEDAFILSHTSEAVDVPEQQMVDQYLPSFDPAFKLDVEDPKAFGSLAMPDDYYEFRYNIGRAMSKSRDVFLKAEKEFEEIFGRSYGGLLDTYRCDDAEVVLIAMGTIASTAREVVDRLREKGKNVGVAKLRVFRPFPTKELRELASKVHTIGILDRSYTFGERGPAGQEVKGALYGVANPPLMKDYILGLGGRDITPEILEMIYDDMYKVTKEGLDREVDWVGLRDGTGRWS